MRAVSMGYGLPLRTAVRILLFLRDLGAILGSSLDNFSRQKATVL